MFNEEQQKAIETIKGQLILVACPGSGKTTTLLGRIHEMIQQEFRRVYTSICILPTESTRIRMLPSMVDRNFSCLRRPARIREKPIPPESLAHP